MSDISLAVFYILACLIPYVLGSLNFAIIASRVIHRDDVREHGSHNAGFTNVVRTYGGSTAVMTLLGDFLKGIAAAFIVREAAYLTAAIPGAGDFNLAQLVGVNLAALFVMLGHVYPIFYSFKGGKGVLVTAGAMLVAQPLAALAGIFVFLLCLVLRRIVSLSSLYAAASMAVCSALLFFLLPEKHKPVEILFATLVALVIFLKHISNIKRLLNGTERILSFKKKKSGDA